MHRCIPSRQNKASNLVHSFVLAPKKNLIYEILCKTLCSQITPLEKYFARVSLSKCFIAKMQRKIYKEGVLDSDVFSKCSVLNIEFRSRIKKLRFLVKSSTKFTCIVPSPSQAVSRKISRHKSFHRM